MSAAPLKQDFTTLTYNAKDKITLNKRVLAEQYPRDRILGLLKSPFLEERFRSNKYSQRDARQYYENEKKQLEAILGTYDKATNAFLVTYKQAKSGYGRVFPVQALGMSSLCKKARNTLIHGLYTDFDLANAHPVILKQLCDKNGIPCPHITTYVEKREE
eukprot:gene12779-15619_t